MVLIVAQQPFPLRRHATVPLGFHRRVSRWPKGRLFQTPPFCERYPAPGEVAHIIGVAHNDHVTGSLPLSPAVGPEVESVVKVSRIPSFITLLCLAKALA